MGIKGSHALYARGAPVHALRDTRAINYERLPSVLVLCGSVWSEKSLYLSPSCWSHLWLVLWFAVGDLGTAQTDLPQ